MSPSESRTRFYVSARVLCSHPIERWFVATFPILADIHSRQEANMDKHKGSREFISHLFSFSTWTDNTAGEP